MKNTLSVRFKIPHLHSAHSFTNDYIASQFLFATIFICPAPFSGNHMEIFTPLEAPFELSLFFRGNLILRYLFKFIYTLSAIWSLATWANDEQSPRHPRLILSNGFTSFLRGIVGRGRPSAYITYHPLPFDLSPAFPSFPLFFLRSFRIPLTLTLIVCK